MSDSNNNDLLSKYEKYSTIAERLARLILLGLAVEIVAVFILKKPPLEAVLTISATALIWLGVWGELRYEKRAREAGDGIVAEAKAEAAKANERTAEAVLETARAVRSNAIAVNTGFVTSELLAFSYKLRNREDLSDSARVFLLVSKFEPFAGTQCDAFITSDDIKAETFLSSLRNALIKAGWIEVVVKGQSSADHASIRGVRIDVDATKDHELLAANTLASALNEEGIAATVNPKTDTTNVIHILIGPKP
jgi:hypothetical protein